VRGGSVRAYELTPEEVGVPSHPIESIAGGDAKTNAEIARAVLRGESGARADIVAANAGAALYVAGVVPDIRDGVALARESIASGKAMEKLEQLIAVSKELA
jgi:anthranilate phosphoribosyltransferase